MVWQYSLYVHKLAVLDPQIQLIQHWLRLIRVCTSCIFLIFRLFWGVFKKNLTSLTQNRQTLVIQIVIMASVFIDLPLSLTLDLTWKVTSPSPNQWNINSSYGRSSVRDNGRDSEHASSLRRPVHCGFRRPMVGMLGLLRKNFFLQYFVVFCLIFGYKERNDYLCSQIKTHPNFTWKQKSFISSLHSCCNCLPYLLQPR